MKKLIITVAVNGEATSKADNPNVPISPEEVVNDVVACCNAGAAIAHIHGRDEKTGLMAFHPEYYKKILGAIREKCDIITNISTGGNAEDPMERLKGLEANPEMCSLNMGSVNFNNKAFVNPPEIIEKYATHMYEKGIKYNLECFDIGHIDAGLRIAASGKYMGQPFFDLLMNEPGAIPFNLQTMYYFLNSIPDYAEWNAVGVGDAQLPFAVHAILLGGHVRVGLEDTLYYNPGELATNVRLVERIVRIAKELGREIAAPSEAREMLGLAQLG